MKIPRVAVIGLVLALALSATSVEASTILVTTESGIVNDGLLDWGTLGTELTLVSNPFNVAVPGVSGLDVTVSQAGADSFVRADQSSFWGGNFGAGEELLWTQGPNGPMTFLFDGDITGFGVQIQADFFGPFSATIEAFNAADVSLGSFLLAGTSDGNADDSAIFIGILSSAQDIRRIVLSVPIASFDAQDFAINSPRIQAEVNATPVPEPTSLILLGTGLVGFASRRGLRRRR